MNEHCPHKIDCPGTDSPVRNLSAETEETPYYQFLGYSPSGNQLSGTAEDCEEAQANLDLAISQEQFFTPTTTPFSLGDMEDSEGNIYTDAIPDCLDETFIIRIPVQGDPSRLYFELFAGELPAGMTFNSGPTDCGFTTISGVGVTPGVYVFSIRACDASGNCGEREYTIPVLGLSPADLPDATVDEFYSQPLTIEGCNVPYACAIGAGVLPAGLTLDSETCTISGTPTGDPGDYAFNIQLTNPYNGRTHTRPKQLKLNPKATPPVDPKVCSYGAGDKLFNDALLVAWVDNELNPQSVELPTDIVYFGTLTIVYNFEPWVLCIFRKVFLAAEPLKGNFDLRDAYGSLTTITAPGQRYCLTVTTLGGRYLKYLHDGPTYTPFGTYTLILAESFHPNMGTAPASITLS